MQSDRKISEGAFLRRKAELIGNSVAMMDGVCGGKTVVLTGAATDKLQAIKAVIRAYTEHGFAGAKYIVDHVPQVLCAQVSDERAESVQRDLEAAGLTVRVVGRGAEGLLPLEAGNISSKAQAV